MAQRIVQVDAFTAQPFGGNPAAVCVLDRPASEAWMRLVAGEMNLSETAFLHPEGDHWRLRWFTPAAEVDLCGHATLASAHVLWEDGVIAPDAHIRFLTRSGELRARPGDGWIELDFPATPASPAEAPAGLLDALGLQGTDVVTAIGRSRFDYLIELAGPAAVVSLRPDFGRLARVEARGVIVTARSDRDGADFLSRFFAPAVGVDEDPVTGSAHCCLAPWWAARLGRDRLVGYQASARGGFVRLRLDGDRVLLAGQAVTMLRGELLQDAELEQPEIS
jgi:PhzF family phenazine biosynthesis protein